MFATAARIAIKVPGWRLAAFLLRLLALTPRAASATLAVNLGVVEGEMGEAEAVSMGVEAPVDAVKESDEKYAAIRATMGKLFREDGAICDVTLGGASRVMKLRSAAAEFTARLVYLTEKGPDQSAAIRKIREAAWTAEAAIMGEIAYVVPELRG